MVDSIDTFARISLDQWVMLVAVVEEGGVHAGARRVGRTHSAVSSAMGKLQHVLGVELLVTRGRQSVPTDAGRTMARRARQLLARAAGLEQLAETLDRGWEPQLRVAVDGLLHPSVVGQALARFEPHSRGSRVALEHVVKSGAAAAAEDPRYDLVLTGTLPSGVAPCPVARVAFVPVVGAGHPFVSRPWSSPELDDELQIVVADTGPEAPEDQGWLRADRRWTAPDFFTARALLLSHRAFAVLPLPWIEADLRDGRLARLAPPQRDLELVVHLVSPRGDSTGPCARRLREAFLEVHGSPWEPARTQQEGATEA
ncbi:MAG: LysR family transcriptional regulator [Myxococcales bacterium]|nr:LysR family transcriptional regulator [Myxococcales bacterium]MCB9712699.1 LysR family transcriptional regulator [Myxococcales bacterium]